MREEFDFKYMTIRAHDVQPTSGKTFLYDVLSKRSGESLGEIRWHGPWRQYCFFPLYDTLYSQGCLNDINKVLSTLAGDRLEAKNAKR